MLVHLIEVADLLRVRHDDSGFMDIVDVVEPDVFSLWQLESTVQVVRVQLVLLGQH